MITTTTGCWTLNDPNGDLAMWENARHMPTWEESENYRIYLGISVNRHYTYQVEQPCHVVTCDECGTPADPEGNNEFCHYPSRAAGFRMALSMGWALIGNRMVCGSCLRKECGHAHDLDGVTCCLDDRHLGPHRGWTHEGRLVEFDTAGDTIRILR
jgi:hypothetical protein